MGESYWSRAIELNEEYLRKIDSQDKETLSLLTARYTELMDTLQGRILELAQLNNMTPDQVRLSGVYLDYLDVLERRMQAFGLYSENLISNKQHLYVQMGLRFTQRTISLVDVNFQKLNIQALDFLIGSSADGGRLYDLLVKSYPDTVDRITKTLIESVAIGRNPRATARLINMDMAGNLSRALRISRTETIMAYREASRQQMLVSGLVKEWERIEQDDACTFCSERNGKRYPLDTVFETHPNCRGTMIPVIG